MATLNGALRSLAAAQRRAQRERERHARESAKLYKQQLKQQEFQNNYEASSQYESYINLIQSLHKYSSDTIGWHEIKNEAPPIKPEMYNGREIQSTQRLKNYKPTFFEKLFGLKKRLTNLENDLLKAKELDRQQNESQLENYNREFAEWEYENKLAIGIIERVPEYYKEVINYYEPFSEITSLGSQVSLSFNQDYVSVELYVKNEEIVPNFNLSLTSSGKLSKKNLPVSKRNEIYQDYVCSALLRVAREIYAHLPVTHVYINAIGEMLNTSTGYIENQVILSSIIPKETIERLNFNSIDASDSMKNFIHNMKFSKTNGFVPVEKVEYIK